MKHSRAHEDSLNRIHDFENEIFNLQQKQNLFNKRIEDLENQVNRLQSLVDKLASDLLLKNRVEGKVEEQVEEEVQ